MLAVLLLVGCTVFDGILTSNYEDFDDYLHSYYDDDDYNEEKLFSVSEEMFSVTEQARVRRFDHGTIKTLNPEELQDVKGALEQIMSGRNLDFVSDTPSTNPVSGTNGNDDLTPKLRNEYDNFTPKPQNEYDSLVKMTNDDSNQGVKIEYENLASKYRSGNEVTRKSLKENDFPTPTRNEYQSLNPKQQNAYDIPTKSRNKYDNLIPTRIEYEILISKPQNVNDLTPTKNEFVNDNPTPTRNKYEFVNDNPTPTRNKYEFVNDNPTPTRNKYEFVNDNPTPTRNKYEFLIPRQQNAQVVNTEFRNKDNPSPTRIEYKILTPQPQNDYDNPTPTRIEYIFVNQEQQNEHDVTTKFRNKYDNPAPTRIEYEILTPNPQNVYDNPTATRIEYELLNSSGLQNEHEMTLKSRNEYYNLTPKRLKVNGNVIPTRARNKEDHAPTRLRSKYDNLTSDPQNEYDKTTKSTGEYDDVTPTTVRNEYDILTPNPPNDHLAPSKYDLLLKSKTRNNKIATSKLYSLVKMSQKPTRAKSILRNFMVSEDQEKEELMSFLSKMANESYHTTTTEDPTEENLFLRADKTTKTTDTTSTTTTSTSTTTSRPTTTKEKKFDVEKFLLIVANLTYDYYTNLTEEVKAKLEAMGVPTCGTPTTTELTTTLPIGPPDYSGMAKDSVRAKCFVCGLEELAIPYSAPCADAFAGDFIPLVPQDPRAKGQIARFRKYCRYDDVNNYMLNHTYPRSIFGRWTGGCAVRWTDLSGVYTQRTCRNRLHATTGRHYASKRMAKLEMALSSLDNGCIISPVATLLPLSRGISLFARFHACVCTGNWCNRTARLNSDIWMTCVIALITIFAPNLIREYLKCNFLYN